MVTKPTSPTVELGVASDIDPGGAIRSDEFIPLLRGRRGIKKYREMRENDAVVGAIMFAIEQMLKSVPWEIKAADDSLDARLAAEIVEKSFEKLEIPFEDFISDVLSFFTFGFSLFEPVFARKSNGRIMLRKIAPRAQWTIDRFELTDAGEYAGARQMTYRGSAFLPKNKSLLFRTMSSNRDPSGRSALRNAYVSYYRLNHIQEIEAVAIERELNGLPVARIPSEYLRSTASADQQSVANTLATIARDIKKNEQGFIMLPSDLHADEEGRLSDKYQVTLELMASQGTRDIDTNKVIIRYQQDIARSVMADFVMLGVNDRGSFAMSKSKSDLFLKALQGYMSNIARTLEKQLFPGWMLLNGIDPELAPKATYGNIAPVDLEELGSFVERISRAGAPLFPDGEMEEHLRRSAGLPTGGAGEIPMQPQEGDEADDPVD